MRAVLDASAAIEVILEQPGSIGTSTILAACESVVAPSLYIPEVANVLRKYVTAGTIDQQGVSEYLQTALDLVDEFVGPEEYAFEALHESIRLKHPIYDLLYLILARRNGAALITLDKKLNSLAARAGIPFLVDILDVQETYQAH